MMVGVSSYENSMEIRVNNLSGNEIAEFLDEHIRDMKSDVELSATRPLTVPGHHPRAH